MTYYTRSSLRTTLTNELPSGIGGASATTYLNEAIADAVAYAGTFVRDVQKVDFVGDGITRRFALTGTNCILLDRPYQETPVGVGTAGVTAASTAPTLTATAGGSLSAGLYYVSYAYTTGLGQTVDSTPAAITVTANQEIVTSAITLPVGSLTQPAVTGLKWYMSPSPGSADIQLAATAANGNAQTFTTAPSSSAGRPLRNYTEMWTYQPQTPLEQDIGTDLSATVDTATLVLGTAPALHARFRVAYECAPAIPTQDSDTIRVPPQIIRVVALMFAHRTFAYVHQSGDTTQHLDAYQKLDLLVQDLQKKASPRPKQRPRMPATDSSN